jgi:hypothetical protein
MKNPPAPYLTCEPWQPFTRRERLRAQALKVCPSTKCRRAKACVDAHDTLYCQRIHAAPQEATPARIRGYTESELEDIVTRNEMRLAELAEQKRELVRQWKAGAFDQLYGKYRAHGVWKYPPNRQYTE